MRTFFNTTILTALLVCTSTFTVQAAPGYARHHPSAGPAAPCVAAPGMMMQETGTTSLPPCMQPMAGSKMPCGGDDRRHLHRHGMGDHPGMRDCGPRMMSAGCDMMDMSSGPGRHDLHRMLYLDRAEELQLTPDQVARLKAIHSDCRKEHIRKGAEIRIARLELTELLSQPNWIPAAAEKLIRRIHTLKGDLQVRQLQAMTAARSILTPEQLKKAAESGDDDDPADLFK